MSAGGSTGTLGRVEKWKQLHEERTLAEWAALIVSVLKGIVLLHKNKMLLNRSLTSAHQGCIQKNM